MNAELHADPSLGHKKKGSPAMKKESTPQLREMRIEIHRAPSGEVTGHTVHHHHMSKPNKSGAFMEGAEHSSFPFEKGAGKAMMTHIGQHLDGGMEAPRPEGSEQEEESEDEPT